MGREYDFLRRLGTREEDETGSGMRTHSESNRTRQMEGVNRAGSVSVLRLTMCMVGRVSVVVVVVAVAMVDE